jgi:diaminohydroxyphosphoribosylaminopyrimidine deaminase/5-amino-6-(5-phosphoribosylamino)uracil reductase
MHQHYMTMALDLAQKGRLTVSPNPMVGCVIVKNDQVIGQGFHARAGEAHAEIHALTEAGINAQDATAYVTLEPCCHHGRTPPCTEALINAGIKEIYIACLDPNPLVAGKGVKALEQAGIRVHVGLRETEAKKLNDIFFHYITQQKPFVIAKWAMSFDGKTSVNANDDKKISNSDSHQHAHGIRQQVDAILIGANTALHDDPLLTVRLNEPVAKQPLRIVLASRGGLPLNLKLFDPALPSHTIVVTTTDVDKAWHQKAQEKNIDVLMVAKNKNNQVDLHALLAELGKREITSLLVEGGMSVLENFFSDNLVNRIHVYLAPSIIGGLDKKQLLQNVRHAELHGDYYFTADYSGESYV